jgi:hypothetical protein
LVSCSAEWFRGRERRVSSGVNLVNESNKAIRQ